MGVLRKALILVGVLMFCAAANGVAKELVVGVDANFMPFEFKVDGKLTGFDVELWDAIAKDLGLDYQWQTMDFNGIIPALQSRSIDAAIAGITVKSEREKVVDFSYPYYDAGLIILVRADNEDIATIEDFEDKVVATKLGTTSADFLKTVPTKDVKLLPNTDNLFMELLSGGADEIGRAHV